MTEASGSKRCAGPRDEFDIRHLSMGCLQGESGRHYQACEPVEQLEFVGSTAGNQEKGNKKKEDPRKSGKRTVVSARVSTTVHGYIS